MFLCGFLSLFWGAKYLFFFLIEILFYFIFYSMWISLEFNPYWSSEIGVLRFLNVYIHIFPQIWEAWDYFFSNYFFAHFFLPPWKSDNLNIGAFDGVL